MSDIGYVKKREIVNEMQDSYLDYAMSVIISRALPDARDGLKPVHRRILYAMHSMGLGHAAKYRKSATVIGETMAKYHPHGDIPIYDTMVRMAQDFSLRYPLIDGQGNWGSIDGDSAAAFRYTEARLTEIAEEMLRDIDKNTVNFRDNYDVTKKEPIVLPTRVPQLLINGTVGIAVGMATSIPPHNLSEVIDGSIHLIDNPESSTEDVVNFIKGPDFPGGGEIYGLKNILEAYATGRGPIVIRGKAEIQEKKSGQFQIIITEIPFQVNKAQLVVKIADLVRDKKLEGIKDLRDESDREGMRIVIDLKNDAFPKKILNRLYKLTELQKSFHLNMLALVDGLQPQVLSLVRILEEFIKHQKEVIKRRTEFDLARAKERAHILEGLAKALGRIDAVIRTIRNSPTRETAHKNLMKRFKFSDRQSTAILEMKLQTLAGLERKKIKDELNEKLKLIKELTLILKSPKKILELIKKELLEIKNKYGDNRRTRIFRQEVGALAEEDLIPKEDVIISLTKGGYIKRVHPSAYKSQRRGGKGTIGMTTRGEDIVQHFMSASTHDNILFFTNKGKVYQTKVYELPEGVRVARGKPIVNFLQLAPQEFVTSILSYSVNKEERDFKFLVMATRNGIIKKTDIEEFGQVRRNGLIAINLKKDDILGWVKPSSGRDDVVLVTKLGQAIRFSEKDVRAMGRSASGVTGVRIKKGDEVKGMEIVKSNIKNQIKDKKINEELLVVTENGFGKKTEISDYKKQRRGGSGIKTLKVTTKNGSLVAACLINSETETLFAISWKGQVIKTEVRSVPSLGRSTQGVRVMRMAEDDRLVSIVCL